MKYRVKTSAFGLFLIAHAMGCSALTLGRASGAVVVGRPLDIVVNVQPDEGDDLASLCLSADVFYGDTQVAPGFLTVAPVLPGSTMTRGQPGSVRLRSSQPVNEPLITANLRAGCSEVVSRRYVFFADLPSDQLPTVAPLPALAAPRSPAAGGASAKSTAGATPQSDRQTAPFDAAAEQRARTVRARSSAGARNVANADESASAGSARLEKTADTGAKAKPRLKLDTINAATMRDPDLKFTMELFTQPSEDAKSADVARALWRALNAQPEEIMQDLQKLQAIATDIQTLQSTTARNNVEMADLKLRLQTAESERFSSGLVYALVALLMACLAGLFFLWRRRPAGDGAPAGQGAGWWQSVSVTPSQPGTVGEVLSTRMDSSLPAELAPRTAFVDIDLDLNFDDSAAASLPAVPTLTNSQIVPLDRVSSFAPPTSWGVERGFSPSMVSALRTTNSEEVLDARQQADFFVSVGQYEKAIHTLQDRVDGHGGDASPLVYLDLMQLLRRLGRRIDFNLCRDKFNKLFTARAPEYTHFEEWGKDLEEYPEIVTHIASEWKSEAILEILEGCIFRLPEDDLGQPFDLNAFEDLLLLHAMVTRLQVQPDRS